MTITPASSLPAEPQGRATAGYWWLCCAEHKPLLVCFGSAFVLLLPVRCCWDPYLPASPSSLKTRQTPTLRA